MTHSDFRIGLTFFIDWREYFCTDVGSRVITAIRVDREEMWWDDSWLNGPPYALNEMVMDEEDMVSCSLDCQDYRTPL